VSRARPGITRNQIKSRHPEIRVPFTTGYFSGTPTPALGSGERLLKKPFSVQELLGKLRDLLDPDAFLRT